jgi:hypothetical protein
MAIYGYSLVIRVAHLLYYNHQEANYKQFNIYLIQG